MYLDLEEKFQNDLSSVEHVLLWSMRAWVIGQRRRIAVDEPIETAFAKIGAPEAASQLFGFMWALVETAARPLELRCLCNPQLSSDERDLLAILAAAQHGCARELVARLHNVAAAQGFAAAIDTAQRIAGALTACGQFLPIPGRSIAESGNDPAQPITLH